ncbi:MAG: glycosyltransferase [Paludibacter sp.]|nr:glycosyltransferase [Paludibacter sp.]
MNNILIICDSFPPAFNPRMGFLCKYLRSFGWNPIIITEYLPQKIYGQLTENQDIRYVNFYHSKNKIIKRIKYIFVFVADFLFNLKNIIIGKKAIQIIENQDISLILSSSSFRPYSALTASKLSRRYRIPFVMDLRDIIEQFPSGDQISKKTPNILLNKILTKIIVKKFIRQRNKILKKADFITTVSQWHADILSKYNKNVKLIYNGFDPDLFFPQITKNQHFIIAYTGRIESQAIKDPSLFFEAIANLLAKNKIDAEIFKIKFYLINEESKKIVAELVANYGIADFVEIFDTVQNYQIPQILNESSILLLLANKSTGENTPKGIMGTKVFEYLAVEKPILCVRNDESCLEETINCANAGIACSTSAQVENFILEKYAEWQTYGYTHQIVNKEYIAQFSRKKQAAQFAALFSKLTKRN